ncbi:type II toxin-antitoxin system Phd/YefM family antitoxin [bacterium]|nr:MAG: type II toxin-antitoxin system Phd/YefM family antitoxin [bacterium]
MIDAKTTISLSEARKRIFEIADSVQSPNKVYTLTSDGKPKVVIMSAEEYESWLETMEVLTEFPDIQKDIMETEEAFNTGEYKNWTTLDDLKQSGSKLELSAVKSKRKYGVHSSLKTKSTKRA